MPNYDYDFRILIDSKNGEKKSYGTASFVSADGTTPILTTSQVLDRINSLEEIIYYNAKTYTTSSLDALFLPRTAATFTNTDSGGDYQFLSASIKGNSDSGSIVFTGNSTPSGSSNDFIKRYKFYGNKVCNVLGIPENYWIYVDKFRLTNTGSEQNYLSGDVLGQSLHLTHNLSIANRGAIESDLPFQHAKDTDRWLKWRNVSGSVPHNELQIGYSNLNDRYEIRTSDSTNHLGGGLYPTLPLVISASNLEINDPNGAGGHISASGGIRVNNSSKFNSNLTIAGQTTSFTNSIIHNLKHEHNTNPMGITFFGYLGKMQFKLPVTGSSHTLMELSSSDAGTATLDLTGDINVSGEFKNNITASGTISIPDSVSGGRLLLNGNDILDNYILYSNFDGADEMEMKSGHIDINADTKITLANNTNVTGHITASGNISASGFVFDETRDKTAEISTTSENVWKTIALCKTTGNERASATFVLTEEDSGHHSAYTFNATHHFGKSGITVYNGGYYGSNGSFDALRILTSGTYSGSALQVHIASDASDVGSMQVHMYNNSHDDTGWELEPFTDVVNAGGIHDLTTNNCEVNLRVNESQEVNQNQQGFVSTAGIACAGRLSASKGIRLDDESKIEWGGAIGDTVIYGSGTNLYLETDNDIYFRNVDASKTMVFDGSSGHLQINRNHFHPPQELTVEGSISSSNTFFHGDNSNFNYSIGHDTDQQGFVKFRPDAYRNDGTKGFVFSNDGDESILTISASSTARVGVGTLNPATTLDVDGYIAATGDSAATGANLAWKVFTGTLGEDSSETQITHGVTNGKKRIVGVTLNVESKESGVPGNATTGDMLVIPTWNNIDADAETQIYFDDSKIYVYIDSAADAVGGQRYTMMVQYTATDLY